MLVGAITLVDIESPATSQMYVMNANTLQSPIVSSVSCVMMVVNIFKKKYASVNLSLRMFVMAVTRCQNAL